MQCCIIKYNGPVLPQNLLYFCLYFIAVYVQLIPFNTTLMWKPLHAGTQHLCYVFHRENQESATVCPIRINSLEDL